MARDYMAAAKSEKKKKKTRQEQMEDQMRAAGMTEEQIARMRGKKKGK